MKVPCMHIKKAVYMRVYACICGRVCVCAGVLLYNNVILKKKKIKKL